MLKVTGSWRLVTTELVTGLTEAGRGLVWAGLGWAGSVLLVKHHRGVCHLSWKAFTGLIQHLTLWGGKQKSLLGKKKHYRPTSHGLSYS